VVKYCMRLDKLPPVGHFERSLDELLSESITAYFLGTREFPENQAEIRIFGHETMPPTVYDVAWKLEPSELWLAHRVGTIYHDVNAKGEFVSAGAAAILVTDQHLRLMIGTGVYNKSSAVRGKPSEGTHLEKHVFRFIELSSIGAGDVLIVEHWKLGKFFLKIPWARSFAALISGLRANAKSPKMLTDSVVNLRSENRLGSTREVQVLDVQGKV
jgi:hypothetical protein